MPRTAPPHEPDDRQHALRAGRFAANFLLSPETLRQRQTMKWQFYPPEILPAWVAEMDYDLAPAIADVLRWWAQAREAGYPYRQRDRAEIGLARAFSRYTLRAFDWETDPNNVLAVNELVQAIYLAIMAFSEPGEGVLLQTPCYPPFYQAIDDTGRRLRTSALVDDGSGFAIDFEHAERQLDANTRILILCNPHNPTGRVLRRDELEKLADFVEAHDLLVIADEIHADLIYPDRRHIPFATVRSSLAARTVTLNSASKSFNIPGLRCGVMYFGTPELKRRFTRRLPARLLGYPAGIGIDATVAAWDDGEEWLGDLRHYLYDRRAQTLAALHERLPQARIRTPEATYFAWLDLSELALPAPAGEWYRQRASLALNAGEAFIQGGEQRVRLNFATSENILAQVLGRLIDSDRS
ncbi:MalY/PatB family protein [Affinibrenneria salicis]|nr:aminotransferase class I/II-fold pyridoxal phosphate-dependent enzyme [Affinibrenneria salicis]